MITVWTKDQAFTGRTWDDIVTEMRLSTPLIPDPNNEEYMENVAGRVRIYNGSEIKTDSAESFIFSLREIGLVSLIDKPSPGEGGKS